MLSKLPIASYQWPYFCVKWNCLYYVFVRLVFGCRFSLRIFDTLSQAICWIESTNYGVRTIFHLLDDFLIVDEPNECVGLCTKAVMSLFFCPFVCSPSNTKMCGSYRLFGIPWYCT